MFLPAGDCCIFYPGYVVPLLSSQCEALRLGLNRGFMQEKSSAKEEYTPPFNLEGLEDL